MKKESKAKKIEIPMDLDVEVKIKEKQLYQQQFKVSPKKQNLPDKSYILTGSDSTQIHEENVNLLRTMSEDQIKEERENIIATMDPAILAYLKSKRKKMILQNKNLTIQEQNEVAEDVKIEEIRATNEILGLPTAEKWLNFDVVEANKLAWMKDVNIPNIKKSQNFEAR